MIDFFTGIDAPLQESWYSWLQGQGHLLSTICNDRENWRGGGHLNCDDSRLPVFPVHLKKNRVEVLHSRGFAILELVPCKLSRGKRCCHCFNFSEKNPEAPNGPKERSCLKFYNIIWFWKSEYPEKFQQTSLITYLGFSHWNSLKYSQRILDCIPRLATQWFR